MANEPDAPAPFSLRRWSQRKLEVAREAATRSESVAGIAPVPAAGPPPPPAGAAPASVAAATTATTGVPPPARHEPPLPPVDTLTIDSDFAPFLQPKVAEDVKRAALRKLFSDPQFNVMDGLDIYIGDYTQPDPMPVGMLDKLGKVYGLLDKSEADPRRDDASGRDAPVDDASGDDAPGEARAVAHDAPAEPPTVVAEADPAIGPDHPDAAPVVPPSAEPAAR